jgi:hypothetical protein
VAEESGKGAEKRQLSAKEIADMTRGAFASADLPQAQSRDASRAGAVKAICVFITLMSLACIVMLIVYVVRRDKGALHGAPESFMVSYQEKVADGMALLAYRQYDKAADRFRMAAAVMVELRDRQEYSGMEYQHLDRAIAGAYMLAADADDLKHDAVMVKGSLALMLKARRAMNEGHKALGEKNYDEAVAQFTEAAKLYEEVRAQPKYSDEKHSYFEEAMTDALRLVGVATRMKADSEPLVAPGAPPPAAGAGAEKKAGGGPSAAGTPARDKDTPPPPPEEQ